jgi:hypothetical protein
MPPSESSVIPSTDAPGGGRLIGFADLKNQTAGCSAATNLQSQAAPLIALMSCQLKILKLLKPLVDVIRGLPQPSAQALQEFSKAAIDLVPCFQIATPAGLLPFLRDLLCLEIRSLHCFLRNLQALIMSEVTAPGTTPAALDARAVLDSYPPIIGILDLASGLFQFAGLPIPQAPALAGGTDRSSLLADQSLVATFTGALETAADALGGCP